MSKLLSNEPSIPDCSEVIINGQLIRIEPYRQCRLRNLAILDIASILDGSILEVPCSPSVNRSHFKRGGGRPSGLHAPGGKIIKGQRLQMAKWAAAKQMRMWGKMNM